jgi:hypothetical protein
VVELLSLLCMVEEEEEEIEVEVLITWYRIDAYL